MSFASEIKRELMKISDMPDCCASAELCAIICFAGNIVYSGGGMALRIVSENAVTARRCFSLLKRVFSVTSGIDTLKSKTGRGGFSYSLLVSDPDSVWAILSGLYLVDDSYNNHVSFRINERIISSSCCKKAFVRGAFLGAGSTSNPKKAYHMEFVTHRLPLSRDFSKLLAGFGLSPKTIKRKSSYVIYFKNSEEISDILSIIGAHAALMRFVNIRIMKEKRNDVNRHVNCETANMDKTVDASLLQIKAIEAIQNGPGLDSLPSALFEVARLRLGNGEASLRDIGLMLNPPLSKSGVNHRFRKILEIADKLGG